MEFKTEYPRLETTIETIRKAGSLVCNHKAIVHFRNYQGWLDSVDYITLEGDKNAWYGIKNDFRYDYTMCKLKEVYKDEFGRKMKVTLVNYKNR